MGKKSKLFLVLCLHRSGSSATAGVMYHLGIHMGDSLMGPVRGNIKGLFEDCDFVILNDKILHHANGSWDVPPILEQIQNCGFPEKELRSFLTAHHKPVWGLKDPRTLLTFQLWQPHLEELFDITYVFVHRPFVASVRSLANRDGMSIEEATGILSAYQKNKESFITSLKSDQKDIIDVNFEELVKNPSPFVHKINLRTGREPDYKLDKVLEFIDERLKYF